MGKTSEQTRAKYKATYAEKARIKIEALKDKVPKDDLYRYYIIENHTYLDTLQHFNIVNSELIKLLKEYDCKKPKQLSSVHCKNTKEEKYGDPGYNNREKATSTCLLRTGVDNPFKDIENMKRAYIEKLGVEHPMKLESIVQKQHETAVANSISRTNYGAFGMNSKPNRKFKSILNNLGLEEVEESQDFTLYQREFMIGRSSFDFKISDYLIEVNPVSSHNSTDGMFGVKEADYHFNKSKLAWENGYKCIHVWDWDDYEEVVKNILSGKYENNSDLDKTIYLGDLSTIKPTKYIWNKKLKKLVDEFTEDCVLIYGVGHF